MVSIVLSLDVSVMFVLVRSLKLDVVVSVV